MIDMKLWEERMTDDIIDANRQKILANKFADEAAQKLNIAPIKVFIESRPYITMERKGDNCLIPWKKDQDLKGKYLCSLWWNMFDGGTAYLNYDGSVSYQESHTVFETGATTSIDAYLSYNHEDNTFKLSDIPDYETAEHLPFRSPEEYDKWQEEND
jgi:hypothetical protein